MITKTQIKKRIKRKRNPELVETIYLARKNNHLELAKKLSGPTRLQKKVNLDELNKLKEAKIIIAGKVLGSGNIEKKISVFALGFSEQASEKLKKAGCETKTILEEIKKNPKLEEIGVL